jgi:threonine dehydratase
LVHDPKLVAATDGNHGRAVARTARLLGIAARVYVPTPVPRVVTERISAEGALVNVVDDLRLDVPGDQAAVVCLCTEGPLSA